MKSRFLLLLGMMVGPTLAAGQGVPQSVPPGDSGSQIGTSTSPGPTSSATPSPPHSTGNSFLDAIEHRGFVGMLLDHRAELQLAAKQITALGALEQVFHTQTDSATRQLDSLRKATGRMTNGVSLRNATSLNATQLGAFLQAQQTMAVLVQHVLTVQQQTKQRALVLLTPGQKAQAAAIEKQMRQLLNTTLHAKGQGNQPQGSQPPSQPIPTQSAH